MNRIAIIVPWYGKLPNYFPIFLKGLDYNKDVLDILFITDLDIEIPLPKNFKLIQLPWDKLKSQIQVSIGEKINLVNPYKLCDFKPMYGKIFENEIKEYEYWGYGDIDLIYGDIKRFLPFDGIENYDVLTFRENVMHGPFAIIKNSKYTNNLFYKTNKLEYILSNPKCIGFDEAARKKPWRTGIRLYNFIELDDLWDWSSIVQYEADNGKLKLFERYYCLEYIHSECILKYSKGKLNIGMEEYAFFHWVSHKELNNFTIPTWVNVPDTFYIHKTGFYKKIDLTFIFIKNLRELNGRIISFLTRIKDSYNYRFR